MKKGLPIILMAIVTIAAAAFAYDQKKRHDVLREVNTRLREEIKQVRSQAEVARLEAAKLRYIITNEKKVVRELDQKMKEDSKKN